MDEHRQPEQPGSEPGSSAGPAGMPSAPGARPTPPPAWEAPSQQQGWQGSQGPGPGPGPYGGPPTVRSSDADARQWSLLAHVLAGITGFIGPLIIWAIKKDEHPFAKDQTTEALNFGISLTIAQIVLMVAGEIFSAPFLFGFLRFCVWTVGIVLAIMAGLKARDGTPYRYPYAIRLLT